MRSDLASPFQHAYSRRYSLDAPWGQGGSWPVHLVLDGVSLEQGGDVWLKDINLELSSGMTVLRILQHTAEALLLHG